MQNELQTDWFNHLIDDCQNIIVEAEFASRWILIEGYHTLGARILEDKHRIVQGGSSLRKTLSRVTKFISISERTLYRAVQFAQQFPDLALLPEGKNTSWRKICNEYLPEHEEPYQPEYDENIETENECPECGYEW